MESAFGVIGEELAYNDDADDWPAITEDISNIIAQV